VLRARKSAAAALDSRGSTSYLDDELIAESGKIIPDTGEIDRQRGCADGG
jgi:hypothetical protein